MPGFDDLRDRIRAVDGRGYKAYASIKGSYRGKDFILFIDHVQSDPFAPPSRCRARVAQKDACIPPRLYQSRVRKTAAEDYLARQFHRALGQYAGLEGSGNSGRIEMEYPGQEIIPRTAVVVNDEFVEARFAVGLPARGRTISGGQASRILLQVIDSLVKKSLFYDAIDRVKMKEHVEAAEDQAFLRNKLSELGLVGFIADGSVLPRESGHSDRPAGKGAVPFQSPPELKVEIVLPNRGTVLGMGIPCGVTLIVGGGYHGKSTLLKSLERGVYNHIPGDGRQLVVTVPGAVKIRAEDGRSVEKVNISPFIGELPGGIKTSSFSTSNASGSTSQAANIAEALEMGAKLLLLDEDTSATNFMIRDERMQHLVAMDDEPITPFVDRVRDLYERLGVSTVLVMGGSGDYFAVADRVIMMNNYRPADVTAAAGVIAAQFPSGRRKEGRGPIQITPRVLLSRAFPPGEKVKARGISAISYGIMEIDLWAVEQLVDPGQTRAIAEIMRYAGKKYIDGKRTLQEIIVLVLADIEQYGLDIISPFYGEHPGELALPRCFEVAAAFNRYSGLTVE